MRRLLLLSPPPPLPLPLSQAILPWLLLPCLVGRRQRVQTDRHQHMSLGRDRSVKLWTTVMVTVGRKEMPQQRVQALHTPKMMVRSLVLGIWTLRGNESSWATS